MAQIQVKKVAKEYNKFKLTGTFTAGEIESIITGLSIWCGQATLATDVRSPVAEDVWFALRQAVLDGNGRSILDI